MNKITREDFDFYLKRESTPGKYFCGNCDQEVTANDCDQDGYTNCCNEPVVTRDNFLKSGKLICIQDYVNKIEYTRREPFISQTREAPFYTVIVVPEEDITIKIDLNDSIDTIGLVINQRI